VTQQSAPDTPVADSPDAERLLEAVDVTAGYGDLAAVRGASLHLLRGEAVALFGANGAGKTTTLMALAGVLPCMRGEVRWKGRRVPGSLTRLARDGLTLVPEGRSITTRLSVRDNLELGRGGVSGALRFFPELGRLLDRPGGLLSGGEQQMVVLGRALAARPLALLVDELSLGLAPVVVARLLSAIRQAVDQDSLAVLLVEQQARRALSVADRWYLLSNGSIVSHGEGADSAQRLELAYLASMAGPPGSTDTSLEATPPHAQPTSEPGQP
jgi:branched-chain amino acid transport system ATP-binding protein